ncbi:VOC family protein, partial [Streptomyces lonarensis]|uniref:VOC family protein n=1 Tax=Streptomyces lonarensis TaxID=700599 RepID=UPI0030C7688F
HRLAARLSIACADPARVARFWAALLGGEPVPAAGGGVALAPPAPLPALLLRPAAGTPSARPSGDGAVVPEFTVDDVPATAGAGTAGAGRPPPPPEPGTWVPPATRRPTAIGRSCGTRRAPGSLCCAAVAVSPPRPFPRPRWRRGR